MSTATPSVEVEARRLLAADTWRAFVQVRPDPRRAPVGPLAGARLVVKDNIEVQGMAYGAGQPLYAGRQGQTTASAVRRLRAAGARFLGMTRTDAGGFGVTTPEVDNPRLPGHIAGGSSGGGAAALAGGLADLALCTDTGGSARIPAACCGLFGFKPTHGLFATDGVWPLAPAFDDLGLMASHLDFLELAALALGVAGDAPGWPGGRLRIGVDAQRAVGYATQVREDFLALVQHLRAAAVEITPVSLPDIAQTHEAHGTLVLHEAREVYASVWPAQRAQLAAAAQKALAVADMLTPDHMARMQGVLDQARATMARVFDQVDVVLTPALIAPVPQVGQARACVAGQQQPVLVALTSEPCLANLVGCPALVLPGASHTAGLCSWQLMARPGADVLLLAAARHVHPFMLEKG